MIKELDASAIEEYMVAEPIEIKNYNLTYPSNIIPKYQFKLFDNEVAKKIRGQSYNRAVGVFYEILTTSITGGEWMGLKDSSQIDEVYKPDVISENGIYDAKSVAWHESCKLQDFQMDKHLVQEATGEFIKPRRKVFIPIFKHKIAKPWETFDKAGLNLENILISTLCEQTGFLLLLPFKVAYHLYTREITAKCKSRYEGDRGDNETRFLGKGIKEMLIHPEEVLTSVQLNPKEFEINKTHFPKGISINGKEVKPFPILAIEYQNGSYGAWLKEINEMKKDELERIRNEKRTREDYRAGREGPHKSSIEKELEESQEGLELDFKKYHDIVPF